MLMVEEVISKYKNNLEENIKQSELNKKIDNLLKSFDSQEKFNKLNLEEVKKLLILANYDDIFIEKAITTIKYIQINNTLNDVYRNLFKEKFNNLFVLKKEVKEEDENLLQQTNSLLESIKNPKIYIKNFDLLFKIFADLSIDIEDILKYIKEIDKHNKEVSLMKTDTNTSNEKQKDIEEIDASHQLKFIDFMYINDSIFTAFEKELLNNEYLMDKQKIEEKLEYIYSLSEFSFLKNNLKKYKQLLVVLLVFSNIEIIKEIVDLCKNQEIDIETLLPVFFISSKSDCYFVNYEDEFYKNLSGAFENFKETISSFSKNIKASDLVSKYSNVCMTDFKILKANIGILKEYSIPLSTQSINCLIVNNLRERIDRFIEAGLYEYIKNVPAIILNNDDAFFYRIYYAKKNNIQIKKRFLFKNITDIDGLDINHDNYQEKVKVYKPKYITSSFYKDLIVKENDERDLRNDIIIKLLSDYQVDNFTYNVNGILFSINKVIRLYQNYVNTIQKMSGYSSNMEIFILIRGIIFAFISDLILDKEDTKKVILSLLKKYIKFYGLDRNDIIVLCENFDISEDEKENLFNQNIKN